MSERLRFEVNDATGLLPHEVEIQEEKSIGQGGFGEIFSCKVKVFGKNGDKAKYIRMVIKRFRDIEDPYNSETNARESLEKYKILQKAGVRVFKTYRLGSDRKSILMTSGHSTNWVCIGSNLGSSRLTDFPELNFQKLPSNLEIQEVIANIIADIKKLTDHRVEIYEDCLFFLVNLQHPEQLDYVFGDHDNIEIARDELQSTDILKSNIFMARHSLTMFLKKNGASEEDRTTCEELFKKALRDAQVTDEMLDME